MREPIKKTLRALKSFSRFPKSAAAAVLDRDFAERCRLPELSPELARRIYSWPVVLPPLVNLHDGTQDLPGLVSLLAIAKAIDAQRVFEIGTFTGVTTLALALNLPHATIHTLDLPTQAKGSLRIDTDDAKYMPDHAVRRVFTDWTKAAARIVQHEADSAKFAFEKLGPQFDLVYVDGAHSYEYVRNDTEAAFRIVAADGAIVWDDYSRFWPGVAAYLDTESRPATYCLPGIPRRLAVWFGDLRRIRAGCDAFCGPAATN
ncbi:MAG: O-methyltransferase [Candidatus Binataceae bacterium]